MTTLQNLDDTVEMTFDQLIEMIETDLPGWGWLVRKVEDGNDKAKHGPYFANITHDLKTTIQVGDGGVARPISTGKVSPAMGKTPLEALMKAYSKAVYGQHKELGGIQ